MNIKKSLNGLKGICKRGVLFVIKVHDHNKKKRVLFCCKRGYFSVLKRGTFYVKGGTFLSLNRVLFVQKPKSRKVPPFSAKKIIKNPVKMQVSRLLICRQRIEIQPLQVHSLYIINQHKEKRAKGMG